jgi:hypothetical protein
MSRRLFGAIAFAVASLAFAASAAAQPACSTLSSPVYVSGASGSAPLMRWVSAQLKTAGEPLTIVFVSTTTCVAIDAIVNSTPATGTATYWLADGTAQTCALPMVTGRVVDMALAGTGSELCPLAPNPLPSTIGHYLGPISSMSIIVHHTSTETSISAEALRAIYTMGAAANVAPWNDNVFIFKRNDTASTQLWTAVAAGISPSGWFGTDTVTSTAMITAVGGAGNESKRFGFATSEIVDANPGAVHALAYQHTGQTCGYWPDSTSTARDKANVRNGQYWLWGSIHFYAVVDGSGMFVNNQAKALIELITGAVPPPAGVSVVDATIKSGNVPTCAMRVMRTTDVGPVASYAPPNPCGCYYEYEANGSTSCASCAVTPCANPTDVCRNDFCEAY